MPAQRKIFRIEESLRISVDPAIPTPDADDVAALRHHELMTTLTALQAQLDQRTPSARPTVEVTGDTVARAHDLKRELDLIHEAIRRTKEEVGGLEGTAFIGPQMARVGRELDAVIAGTERATQNILKSAEDIDQITNTLASMLKDGYTLGLAQDIREHVVKIFEACNFQDLTGQRIGKVVATLKFIEDHINRMQNIWREIGPGAQAGATPKPIPPDSNLLNGPMLPDDVGHSTQADIDTIFDSN